MMDENGVLRLERHPQYNLQGVSVAVKGVVILDSISLTIDTREVVGVRGESGAGKSTLLSLLGGIQEVAEGNCCYEGNNLRSFSKANRIAFRRSIGFVFQSFHLLPHLTVFENIALPLRLARFSTGAIKARVLRVLEKVGLSPHEHFASRWPLELSGGQQQRVAIARAVVAHPRVLLADEPTGNLDEHSRDAVLDLLTKLKCEWGMTMIIASHSELVLDVCDRVITLAAGKIVDQASTITNQTFGSISS